MLYAFTLTPSRFSDCLSPRLLHTLILITMLRHAFFHAASSPLHLFSSRFDDIISLSLMPRRCHVSPSDEMLFH